VAKTPILGLTQAVILIEKLDGVVDIVDELHGYSDVDVRKQLHTRLPYLEYMQICTSLRGQVIHSLARIPGTDPNIVALDGQSVSMFFDRVTTPGPHLTHSLVELLMEIVQIPDLRTGLDKHGHNLIIRAIRMLVVPVVDSEFIRRAVQAVQILADSRGVRPNLVDHNGRTAFMIAAGIGAPEPVLKALLGIPHNDPNLQDPKGYTGLMVRCIRGYPLSGITGVDPNLRNKLGGHTALMMLKHQDKMRFTEFMRSFDTAIDPNIQDDQGYTALAHFASDSGSHFGRLVGTTTKLGDVPWRDTSTVTKDGQTLLTILIRNDNVDGLKALIRSNQPMGPFSDNPGQRTNSLVSNQF